MRTASQVVVDSTTSARSAKKRGNALPSAQHAPWQALQRHGGNSRLAGVLQAKLTVSNPCDIYEQEADRVADDVLRMPEPAVAIARTPAPHIQRLCPGCEQELNRQPLEEEEPLQTKPLMPGGAQQRAPQEEEELLQARSETDGTPAVGPDVEDAIHALPGRGSPLPESVRSFMEPRLHADFSAVRVHTDSHAHDLARAVNAQAFTFGRDVVFAAGHYAPESERGKHLIAHELTHVVQQGGAGCDLSFKLQRAVDFTADFSNISVSSKTAAAIAGESFDYEDAEFSADAEVIATGDSVAELGQWDVGVLQDMIVNWEREYWRRQNSDKRGRFVEQKFRPINTRFRDQADGAATVWSADSEHQELSALAATPVGGRFRATTTVHTSDSPGGSDTVSGSSVPGMDASDGARNVNIQRIGTRFDTWISAHNTVTGAWRHLRRLNWNYQRSLDFTGGGATLAVGPEAAQVGHHGPHAAGGAAPLTAGTTANDATGDAANWHRRRVDGWT
jgi:hypothetical protein